MHIDIEKEFLKYGYKQIHTNIPDTLKARLSNGEIYCNGNHSYIFISASGTRFYDITDDYTHISSPHSWKLHRLSRLKHFELALNNIKKTYQAIGILKDYLIEKNCVHTYDCSECIFNGTYMCNSISKFIEQVIPIDTSTHKRNMFYSDATIKLSSDYEKVKQKFIDEKNYYIKNCM